MEPNTLNITQSQKPSNGSFFNPFPGLRPFDTNESHLFFGREGQSQEVLKFLAKNRFIGILGTSGSGKSSLMYCGVIPILQGGFITEAGTNWEIISFRPGQAPIRNLSKVLSNYLDNQEDKKNLTEEYINSTLNASSLGLVEVLKKAESIKGKNILLLADQFEELFRFRKIKQTTEAYNEVLAYIKLLLEVLHQNEVSAYIVLTMRSDFIGECAQFQELTSLINDSHYLIPQMTRENFRQAILGPVAVGGGKISDHLVQQLLNDIGDNPDQLPILQHALMRTWNAWAQTGNTHEPMDIRDYENVGKLTKALSEHANEAYNELTPDQKILCQSIFRTITEKGGDNRGVRRPTTLGEIVEIAHSSVEELTVIIDNFRTKGRSFLTPRGNTPITKESVIDISHESLMRIWDKLTIWVNEEYESVQMYKRLAHDSEKFHLGETGLWRPPDLQLALNWRENQKPTLTWAKRHHPAFERALVFLDSSKKEFDLEEENKIKQQKRALRRSKIFAIVLGSAAIISMVFMFWAFDQQGEAKKQTEIAKEQKILAEQEKENAQNQQKIAEEQSDLAQQKEEEALEQKELADQERKKAISSAFEAQRQQKIATQKSEEAAIERKKAEESATLAFKQQKIAEEASQRAQKLRMISISQSMAVKSLQITADTNLKALIAFQAYKYNDKYSSDKFNPDIYNGLYFAQKFLFSNDLTDYRGHKQPVRDIAINNSTIYSASSDGKLIKWDIKNKQDSSLFFNSGSINRSIDLSDDNKYLTLGLNNGKVLLFDLSEQPVNPIPIFEHRLPVAHVLFNQGNTSIISASVSGLLTETNRETNKSRILSKNLKFKQLSRIEDKIIGVSHKGSIITINSLDTLYYKELFVITNEDGISKSIVSKREIQDFTKTHELNAVMYDFNNNILITGEVNGELNVWNATNNSHIATLIGHTARVNKISINSQLGIIASASNDGSIHLWKMTDYYAPPFKLTDNESWVLSLEFTNDNKALISAYADGNIRRWDIDINEVAIRVKEKIKRNMTKEEWQQYVAKDIPYEKTIQEIQ
jgi:WD40 repeat protein/flagellar biosynthesis GTPase FlhF